MVKLFLAEDEIAMREGIRRNIAWEEIGVDFCGEAGDGELAWPLILELKPDIVITDIKMPFMDGLQLAGLIKKELPDTRIIILSGYGEFEYAQEALRIGVTEYLLKPITPRQLKEVISRQAAAIEEEKKKREERIDWLEEERRERSEHDRRILFKTLVSGGMSSHNILEKADGMGFRIGAPYYCMLLLYVIRGENTREQDKTDELFDAVAEGAKDWFVFEHSMDSVAVLISGKTPGEIREEADALKERVVSFLKDAANLHYFISEGRTVSHLSQIYQVYHEAYRAASGRFFLSPDRVVTADTPLRQLLSDENPNPINTDEALQNGNLRSIWENFMRTGTLQESADFVEDAFSSVGEANTGSILFLNYLTMDCYFSMVRFLKEMGKDPGEVNRDVGDINAVIGSLSSPEDSKMYLTRYLEEVIRQRDNSASRRNDLILKNALCYIDEHFTDGDLSLQSAAAAAGISPNRFSTFFSHEMGMTFIDYLIGKRMDRASELLMTTDMKAFEIAYASGYNDPHYFSATFKKLKGMSPMEYRKRGQDPGNIK